MAVVKGQPRQTKIKFPTGADAPQVRTFQKRDGGEGQVTNFSCLEYHEGAADYIIPHERCQAWGDRTHQIGELVRTQQPIDVTLTEVTNEKDGKVYKNLDVQFPGGSGGNAAYRGKFSGGASSGGGSGWKPKYRGKAVPFDAFWDCVGTAIGRSLAAYSDHLTKAQFEAHLPAIIEASRALTNTYVIACEESMTFIPGYEPDAEAEAATASGDSPQGAAASGTDDLVMRSWEQRIANSKTEADYESIKAAIIAAELPEQQKATLMEKNFEQKVKIAA